VGLTFTAVAAYTFVRWRPFRVEIRGGSMRPALEPGDWALAVATSRFGRGEVVIVEHPARESLEMVKRIVAVPGELAPDGRTLAADEFWLEGDAPDASTDSRALGPIRRELLKGRVRLVYWPLERRGIVRTTTRQWR
jgi:nickel-type superoxide dismutase maturation protease